MEQIIWKGRGCVIRQLGSRFLILEGDRILVSLTLEEFRDMLDRSYSAVGPSEIKVESKGLLPPSPRRMTTKPRGGKKDGA